MRTRRRSLALINEGARHPFRQSLPAHVLQPIPDDTEPARRPRFSLKDLREFLMAYCGMFMAVTAFIS